MEESKEFNLTVDVIMLAGTLLLQSGSEIYRVEDTMIRIAHSQGIIDCNALAMPVAIFFSVENTNISRMKRIVHSNYNIEKVCDVNQVSRQLTSGQLTLQDVYKRQGQVLADLLKIPLLPQTKLTKIYRQGEDSTIVTLASQIQQGILPADFTEKKADRSYFEATSEYIPDMIKKIVAAAIRSGIPAQDVQVLAPMYRGPAGIDQINQLMQDLINPSEKDQLVFEAPDCQYRQGDKIIHLVNDAESNVFNGDLGYITDLLPAKYTDSKQDELTINFDGNEIVYQRSEWYKIRLAYAMSIHKSQGSEFPVVILPITKSSHRMLQRNLIYTAITRAKSKLILLGEFSAFQFAVKNTGTARKTYLIPRFSDLLEREEPAEVVTTNSDTVDQIPEDGFILTLDNYLSIDPMIGIREEDIKDIFKK